MGSEREAYLPAGPATGRQGQTQAGGRRGDGRMLMPGDRFGDYGVLQRLGKGGMGEVWLLVSESGAMVAAKVLDPATASKHEARKRFLREAELALGVKHPHLVEVYDVGEDPETGLCYILMEYVPGGTLSGRLREGGALPVADAAAVVRAMASVLELGRQKGIVHRDIKPANIMFAADGTPKLADLGIARGALGVDITMTHTGMIIGTPAYMAPEQMVDAHRVDTRADIYSLGIVFYEMLTGIRPHKDDTIVQLMARAVRGEPLPDVRTLRPEVPAAYAKLIRMMVEPDRDSRIATPGQIVEALDTIARGGTVAFPKSWRRPFVRVIRRWTWEWLVLAAVVILAGLSVLVQKKAPRTPAAESAVAETNLVEQVAEKDDAGERDVVVTPVVKPAERVAVVPEPVQTNVVRAAEPAVEVPATVRVPDETAGDVPAPQTEPKDEDVPPSVVPPPSEPLPPSVTNEAKKTDATAARVPKPVRKTLDADSLRGATQTESVQNALDAMFPGWKTSQVGWTQPSGFMAEFGGVTNVVCAHPPRKDVPVIFSRSVDVTGQYPVLFLRLSNPSDGRTCQLRVKIDGNAVRQQTVSGGWTKVFVGLEKWRDSKVKIDLEQSSPDPNPGGLYWAAVKFVDSQLLSELARTQDAEATLAKKAAAKRVQPPPVRRTETVRKTCGEMFPGWKVAIGATVGEEEPYGRRKGLLVQSSSAGEVVVLSRSMKLPSAWQFPKADLKLLVSVAARSGGEFHLEVRANGKAAFSQEIVGGGWKDLKCDLSPWEGQKVLLELVCTPSGRKRAHAYWNRIEVK